VGNRLDDGGVDPRDLRLAAKRRVGMGDVVPNDVIGVGVQGRLDIVGVLGREVPIDDVHQPAAAAVRLACRNSRPDATHAATKNASASRVGPSPATSAINATATCAPAVANIQTDASRGAKRETAAPMRATARTSTYIRFAGLPSSPIIPTARLTQMSPSPAATA